MSAEARKALTVTQLNEQVHSLLEESFSGVWVEGEVSDPRPYPSGHTYFTLKDAGSQLSAVLFKGAAFGVKFKLEQGLVVLAYGRVSTYVKRGQCQFIVERMEPKSAGALQLAFEQLKRKLEAEGLFAAERKRPIPPFPQTIGIVTSLQGAALRDMLSVLGRRAAGLCIRVFPVPVQGEGAAERIAEAVADAGEHFPDTEVLLVGRGGGSLEDLWAFNEEVLARAIAASKIPVISCVGHETDFTIADFVADLRAPTPSAAAELVAKSRQETLRLVEGLSSRLAPAMTALLRRLSERLQGLARSPLLKDPRRIYEQLVQRIDELSARLGPAARQALAHAEKDLARLAEKLQALSPLAVLSRGYAIAFRLPGRQVLKTARAAAPGTEIAVRLGEGELKARVL